LREWLFPIVTLRDHLSRYALAFLRLDRSALSGHDDQMARAIVELPEGWGPSRVVLVRVKALGYDVTQMTNGYLIVR
jgi:hypothetical protein